MTAGRKLGVSIISNIVLALSTAIANQGTRAVITRITVAVGVGVKDSILLFGGSMFKSHFPAANRSLQLFIFLCLISVPVSAQSSALKELKLADEHRLAATIRYQAGYFVLIHRTGGKFPGDESANTPAAQSLSLLDSSGKEVFTKQPGFDIPDLNGFSLYDVAVGKNGLLVVAATVVSRSNQYTCVLMIYNWTADKLLRIIRNDTIFSKRVAIDEQGNIWSLGYDGVVLGARPEDYNLIHKFSPEGQLLGVFVPCSSLTEKETLRLWQTGKLGEPQVVSNQRGRIYALIPNAHAMLEMDLSGKLLSRRNVKEDDLESRWGDALAIQPDGTALSIKPLQVAAKGQSDPLYAVHRLKGLTGEWEPIRSSSDSLKLLSSGSHTGLDFMKHRCVVGADDSTLIIRDWQTGKLTWLSVQPR
jgi:hypothetical protein